MDKKKLQLYKKLSLPANISITIGQKYCIYIYIYIQCRSKVSQCFEVLTLNTHISINKDFYKVINVPIERAKKFVIYT